MTHLPEELARARRAALLDASRDARRTRRVRSGRAGGPTDDFRPRRRS